MKLPTEPLRNSLRTTHVDGNRWQVGRLSVPQIELLREMKVPGLGVSNCFAHGPIDAVAVACRKLLAEPPQPYEGLNTLGPPPPLKELRDYQCWGVNKLGVFMSRCGAALLADDMGLGKTRQAITLAALKPGRKLVICPASVRLTWFDELEKVLPETPAAVVDPAAHSKLKKCKLDLSSAQFVVTSYDLAEKVYNFAFPNEPPGMIILDEAHNLRGRGKDGKGNKRVKGIKALTMLTPYKLAITGTPIWDTPRDLWMLLDILLNGKFGTRWDFDIRYCAGFLNEWGGMDNSGVSNPDELRQRLSYYMVRRTKQEVAKELPALTRTVEWLDPIPKCSAIWHASILTPNGQTLADALHSTLEFKLDRCVELAEQAPEGRFLLFTYKREHAEELARRLNVPFVHGGYSPLARNDIAKQAITAKKGLVATLDSMSVGVNIQGVASYGIMHAIHWNHNTHLQAEARLHRLGIVDSVQWTYVAVRESADEHVVRVLLKKLEAQMNIIGQEVAPLDLRNSLSNANSAEVERAIMRELYEGLT